jgi:hypothetical protein
LNEDLIDWQKETILYVLIVNNFVKFGITSNLQKRKKSYEKELSQYTFQFVKKIKFETRWEAELIEQIVKWRLRRWAVNGRHEWIELPLQPVLDCISQSINEIKPEFQKHKYIHHNGKNKWDFYKQIAHYYFDDKN